jgi:hypothetical protein
MAHNLIAKDDMNGCRRIGERLCLSRYRGDFELEQFL